MSASGATEALVHFDLLDPVNLDAFALRRVAGGDAHRALAGAAKPCGYRCAR
jgi:hypothetical protein